MCFCWGILLKSAWNIWKRCVWLKDFIPDSLTKLKCDSVSDISFYLVPILCAFALCPLHILCFVGVISDFLCVCGPVHRYWSSARPPVHPSDWLSQWPLQQQLWQTAAFYLAAVFGSPSGAFHHSPRWRTGSTPCLGWAHPPGRIPLYLPAKHTRQEINLYHLFKM